MNIFVLQPKPKLDPIINGITDPDVKLIEKFLEIQSQIDSFDKLGVFDGLRLFEDEVDNIKKNKQQAEVNCRVLTEKTKKEKQDFDNITQATVQGFFKDQSAKDRAISKEEVKSYLVFDHRVTVCERYIILTYLFQLVSSFSVRYPSPLFTN